MYIVYHIATLVYSPIPWFDEETYANITESFLKNGRFYEEARNISWATSKLDLAYGPVYFMLQGLVTTIFGFSQFTFRMTNLMCGLGCLFLLYKVCRQLKFSDGVTLLAMLLIAFDPQFNQFLHSGRMDFVALFFSLSGYLLFMQMKDADGKFSVRSVGVGLLLALAFMTNPRILFSFAFYGCYAVYELVGKRLKNIVPVLIKYATVGVAFAALYSIWVYVEFGSLKNYVSEVYTNSPIMKEHVGATTVGFRINYNMAMHLLSLLVFALMVMARKVKEQANLVMLTAPGIVVFLGMVSGGIAGRYYGLVVPFTTLLVVGGMVNAYHNAPGKWLTKALLAAFVAVFCFKAVYIFATLDQRSPKKYDAIIASHIPQHATVAGDFAYYYIIKNHGWTYQCLEENGRMEEKIAYYQTYKYDFIIINKGNPSLSQYEQTFLKDRYKLVATIEDQQNGTFHNILSRLPLRISEGYGGYIYQYIGQ